MAGVIHELKRDRLGRALAIVSLAGCAIALTADLAGATLSSRIGMAGDTISDLAAGGRWDWLMDGGLYALVAAVLAAALGL